MPSMLAAGDAHYRFGDWVEEQGVCPVVGYRTRSGRV